MAGEVQWAPDDADGADDARREEPRPDVSRRTAVLGLLALSAIGLTLRLSTILTRGLWLDEAVTVRQTNTTLWDVIDTQVHGVHPPLFHILMHYWVTAFGTSELAIRTFALVFGVAAIGLAFYAGRTLYDRRTGLVAAGIIAFSPYLIWYSQEARMYSMLLFFGLLSVTLLAVAVRKNRARDWAAYFLVTLLGLFTHYFFLVLFGGEILYFFAVEVVGRARRLRRERSADSPRRRVRLRSDLPGLGAWLLVTTVLSMLMATWMLRSVFLEPSNPGASSSPLLGSLFKSGLGYGQVPPSLALRFNDVVQVLAEMTVGFHASWAMYGLVAMWPILVYIALVMLDYAGPVSRETKLLLFAASGIPLLWLLGQWQGQVLASRYFIAVAAPAVLLTARVVALMGNRGRTWLLIGCTALLLVAWADQSYNPQNMMRYDNRAAIGYVVSSYRAGDTLIYEPFYTSDIMNYYVPSTIDAYGFPMFGDYGHVRSAKTELGQDLDRVAGGSQRVWLILSFQNIAKLRGDAYNTTMWFRRNGYRITENTQLNKVQVIRFERTATSTVLPLNGAQ